MFFDGADDMLQQAFTLAAALEKLMVETGMFTAEQIEAVRLRIVADLDQRAARNDAAVAEVSKPAPEGISAEFEQKVVGVMKLLHDCQLELATTICNTAMTRLFMDDDEEDE